MIIPTVGRVVWFHVGAHASNLQSDQPLASIITYVHSDDVINLVVFGKGGDCHQRGSVPLWQGEGDAPERGSYAEWMPYQKGQAAKLEEIEAKIVDRIDPDWHKLPDNPPVAPPLPREERDALGLASLPDDPYASVVERETRPDLRQANGENAR